MNNNFNFITVSKLGLYLIKKLTSKNKKFFKLKRQAEVKRNEVKINLSLLTE